MEMENWFGKIKALIMVNGKRGKCVGKGCRHFQMEKSTRVITKKANLMDRVK